MSNYDVIIVGAGMVGLTMAKLLTQQQLSVVIFDRQAPSESPTETDLLRVSAISRASKNILGSINCWNDTLLERSCAYEHMHVWDDVGQGEITFDAAKIGQANLGHIVPNVDLQRALWQQLQEDKNVTLITDVELDCAQWHDEYVQLTLGNGSSYQARLAIAADGAHSWLRSQAGIATQSKSYDHTALVATIKTTLQHGNCARQVFLEGGPLAFLPSHDRHQCSIVWSTNQAHAESLLAMSTEDFDTALQGAFGETQLGQLSCQSQRLSFPLIARHAEHYIKPRLALIGDAAHTIHPLAGQGANIGILDAAALAETIDDCRRDQKDYSQVANLRSFERWRRSENQLMLDSMRSLRELFSGPKGIKSMLRSFGMSQLNRLPVLKQPIIETAMGLRGDLPKTARTPMPEI